MRSASSPWPKPRFGTWTWVKRCGHTARTRSPRLPAWSRARTTTRRISRYDDSSYGDTALSSHLALIGVIRRVHAGPAECDPGAAVRTPGGSLPGRQTVYTAQHICVVHLPREATNERRPAQPHDHVSERQRLAAAFRFLRLDSRRCCVRWWQEFRGLHTASDDSSSLWHVNELLFSWMPLISRVDVEETVVARVLASLRSLCELGLFQKMRIWELLSATLSFLYHPNIWIRQGLSSTRRRHRGLSHILLGAAAFIAAAAKHLPPSDVWCVVYPSLKYFLRSDLREADERSLLLAMKPPV